MVSKICGEEQQYFFVVYRFDIVGQNSVHELGRHTSIDEVTPFSVSYAEQLGC
jgi:hypothetical protein